MKVTSPCPQCTASCPSFSSKILLVLFLHSFNSSLTNFQLVSAMAAGLAFNKEILAEDAAAAEWENGSTDLNLLPPDEDEKFYSLNELLAVFKEHTSN